MPANTKPVIPMTVERHLDLQADLHFFFDTLVTGKIVLDVGAGLGKSKARIRHNRVITYEPSEHCRPYVDICGLQIPAGPFDVVTVFEVLEHVENDREFLQQMDTVATQAIFITTPNWAISQCQSVDHYREYTNEEFADIIYTIWPDAEKFWFAYFKDAEGGWCESVDPLTHQGLKHAVLIAKKLYKHELMRIQLMMRRWYD